MSPAKKAEPSLGELGEFFKQGINRAINRPSIYRYVPHDKQVEFHKSLARGKLYIGGNRSGKTVGGTVEDIWRLRGQHPYREVPPAPVRGRIVTTSYNEGVKLVLIPELAKWIPPSDLINGSWEDSYAKQERMLTLSNGSTCELMSYDQDLDKFAGTSRHFVHFDEEPPKPIYDECRMRLIDTAGDWWITMTPVEGMTWVYDVIYLPSKLPGSGFAVIKIDTAENPYISEAEIETVLEGLTADERRMRKGGDFIQLGGLVFKGFDDRRNVIPPLTDKQLEQIKGWTIWASMDHGLNNPTAWLWHAVSPQGLVVTFDEVYENEQLVDYFARVIHTRNGLPHRVAPSIYVGDPAIKQRNAQTGDSIQLAYMQHGVPIVLGNNDVSLGVNKMNQYLASGKWVITENCSNLLRELPRVKWKTYESAKKRYDNNVREEIHKKDDHAPDSARYFFSFMPDLRLPVDSGKKAGPSAVDLVQSALSAGTVKMGPMYYDANLVNLQPGTNFNMNVDETLGNEW